jgi:hypothetical protein
MARISKITAKTARHIVRDAKTGRFISGVSSEGKRNSLPVRSAQHSNPNLLPLSAKLEQMLEDSWKDNKELYKALRNS